MEGKVRSLNNKNFFVAVFPVVIEEVFVNLCRVVIFKPTDVGLNRKVDSVCLPIVISLCGERKGIHSVAY